jgi:ABC-type antimicrobial peptide transport system permease subunit
VSSTYFEALGLKLLGGRGISATDREGSLPVVVVNQALVDQHFGGKSPIGKRIELEDLAPMEVEGGSREVVGVVSNVTSFGGLRKPRQEARIYEPLAQQPVNRVDIVLRNQGDPLSLVGVLRQRVKGLDGRLSLAQTESMQTRRERVVWTGTFFVRLMGILGAVALLLAAIGIYGVVSYSTERRTREFGIRAALGADPGQIASLVLRKTLVLALWGVGLGLMLSLVLSRAIQSLLYGISATNPGTLAAVAATLLGVSLLASLVPVLRAVRSHPMEALRVE